MKGTISNKKFQIFEYFKNVYVIYMYVYIF